VGVIVVRVWSEEQSAVRARVTTVADVTMGDERVIELVSADVTAIAAEVERWLTEWVNARAR
jgi:hypothetical protein